MIRGRGTRWILSLVVKSHVILPLHKGVGLPKMASARSMSSVVMGQLRSMFCATIFLKVVVLGHPVCCWRWRASSAHSISSLAKYDLLSSMVCAKTGTNVAFEARVCSAPEV